MAFTDAILLERVLQNAASANGNGTPIDVKGKSSAVMQITDTFSAVVNFEASLDGVNWHAVLGQNLTTAAQATNATATGLWAFFVSGFKYLRARISDYVSGTVTVRCAASPAGLAPLLSATINATVDAVNIKDVTDTNTLAIDSNGAASVALTGSIVDIGGVAFAVSGGDTLRNTAANKPDAVAAHAVIPYCYYHAIDTGVVEVTDGTSWVVI